MRHWRRIGMGLSVWLHIYFSRFQSKPLLIFYTVLLLVFVVTFVYVDAFFSEFFATRMTPPKFHFVVTSACTDALLSVLRNNQNSTSTSIPHLFFLSLSLETLSLFSFCFSVKKLNSSSVVGIWDEATSMYSNSCVSFYTDSLLH